MPNEPEIEKGLDSKQASEILLEKIFELRWPITMVAAGGILLLSGTFLLSSNPFEETKVEVLGATDLEVETGSKIISEISGQVQNPGVYELDSNSRVDDLLVKAGGLGREADREWVEKNINRAQKLIDGQKIYIPKVGEQPSQNVQASQGSSGVITGKININSASISELDKLPQIGSTRAQAIIDGRPYATIEQLVEKKVISSSIFEKIKDSIIAQ